ncbi:MAG: TolC family protein [Bacteroidales bacterium]|nr:TolC family protein [Bacteroidales bacterium]
MRTKYIGIGMLVLTLMAWDSAVAQDTVRMSLEDCLRYAYEHNLTVQTAKLNKESAKASVSNAKWNFAPSMSASAGENMNIQSGGTSFNTSAGVNANMTLFSGLANLRTLQQSKLSLRQSELKVKQSQNSIAGQIIQAYMTILMNEERLSYQQEVLKTSEEQLNEGEVKYNVGKLLESDYLLLEANYQSALGAIEITRLTIDNNRLELRNLLCLENGQTVDVTEMGDGEAMQLLSMDEVIRQAEANMPDLEISRMNVDMAKYNVKIAKSAYSPTLGLNGGANYYMGGAQLDQTSGTMVNGGNFSGTVGLNLNIPILRGNTITQVKQSKINLRQAEIQNQQAAHDLRKAIESQYIATAQAGNQYRTSQKMKEAYQANYNVYRLKYENGAVTTVDMLTQQDRFLSALNDYLQNKYTYLMDLKVLNVYMGR